MAVLQVAWISLDSNDFEGQLVAFRHSPSDVRHQAYLVQLDIQQKMQQPLLALERQALLLRQDRLRLS